jgi:hypothetical protein
MQASRPHVHLRVLAPPPETSASLRVRCASCGRFPLAAERTPVLASHCARCAAGFPLTALEMDGSFPLCQEAIDAELARTAPGNYALGYLDRGTFVVFYVGRSDTDLKRRLEAWVGAPSRYEAYAPSGRASWGVHRRGGSPLCGPALAAVAVSDTGYTRFAYSYAPSAEAAYAKECRNFDTFGGRLRLDNTVDPIPPVGRC